MSQSIGAGNAPASSDLAGKPSVSAGQIPDLLKIGAVQSNLQMEVDTDVIDPVVQNSKFIRFTLQNKGILHSHSKIQFGYKTEDGAIAAVNDVWMPINVGIASLIQRATLRIGNQTICEIDDFAHFTAYRSQFMSGESMRERLQYTTGQAMAKKFAYNDEGDFWTNAVPAVEEGNLFGGGGSNTESRGLCANMGRSFYNIPGDYGAPLGGGAATPEMAEMPEYLNLNKDGELSTFQWSLSDFFPFLKTNQLPLYMMKEQIQLEFVLNNEAAQRGWSGGLGANNSLALDPSKTQMIADYIYYPQDMMVSYANANKNLRFSYVDYRLSKLTHLAGTTSSQIRNIGGAGRIVSKVVWGFANDSDDQTNSVTLTYNAEALTRTANIGVQPQIAVTAGIRNDTNGAGVMNVKMNNGFIYPIDVDNTARMFHNVVQAEGLTPYCSRQEYANEGQSLTFRTLEDMVQNTVLSGKNFWNACRLNRGERVNSRGIELYYQMNALPGAAGAEFTLRAYLETMKAATLNNGMVQSFLL
jgi:hypothetical protein